MFLGLGFFGALAVCVCFGVFFLLYSVGFIFLFCFGGGKNSKVFFSVLQALVVFLSTSKAP